MPELLNHSRRELRINQDHIGADRLELADALPKDRGDPHDVTAAQDGVGTDLP
jgi:hypothetical protein